MGTFCSVVLWCFHRQKQSRHIVETQLSVKNELPHIIPSQACSLPLRALQRPGGLKFSPLKQGRVTVPVGPPFKSTYCIWEENAARFAVCTVEKV